MADQLITGTTLIEDKRKESGKVWSCLGANFKAKHPDTDDVTYADGDDGDITTSGAGISLLAPVQLPDKAKVEKVIVYANVSTENWYLIKVKLTGGVATTSMASALLNTEDTTITEDVIDNSNYGYFLLTDGMDAADKIYGARIIYD